VTQHDGELMTLPEAADVLGIPAELLYRRARRGELDGVVTGALGAVLIRCEAVAMALARRESDAALEVGPAPEYDNPHTKRRPPPARGGRYERPSNAMMPDDRRPVNPTFRADFDRLEGELVDTYRQRRDLERLVEELLRREARLEMNLHDVMNRARDVAQGEIPF